MSEALAQLLIMVASVIGGILFMDALDAPARRMARRVAVLSKSLQGK
ncbi:hypothetical protein [Methylobacterium nigriterrae]